MSSVPSILPVLACLSSLAAVVPIALLGRFPNLREAVTFLAAFLQLGFVLAMVPAVMGGDLLTARLVNVLPTVALEFRVDSLGLLFGLVASFLWIPTSLYSIGYMRGLREHSQARFFAFFALSLSATLGVAFAGNLLTLYVFYEILSLSTYPLVAHHQDRDARSGGRTYLAHLLVTSIGFALPALVYCFAKSGGDLDFRPEGFLAGSVTGWEAAVLFTLLTLGFAKNGIMPFHSWLPGAMVAPTPVSALLHAVAVVKVGVFCVLRVVTGVFGIDLLRELEATTLIAWVAAFTVVVSSLIALSQDNLKRRLAFSTIGQLSYIVLGAALLTPHAVQGGILHIVMHAFGKITLFFCAGAIFVATGKKYVSQLNGLGPHMPLLFGSFALGALSVTGLPPLGGFWSKFYLVLGAADAGRMVLLSVYLVSSVLNAAYFFPIVSRAFFRPLPEGETGPANGAPAACVFPLTLTALGSVLLFFFPGPILELASLAIPGA